MASDHSITHRHVRLLQTVHSHRRKLDCYDRFPSNSLACRTPYPVENEK
jgi:hypothetical protein